VFFLATKVGTLRLQASRLIKLGALIALLIDGYIEVRWKFPRWSETQRAQAVQHWARRALAVLGIEVEINGEGNQDGEGNAGLTVQGPLMLVSNHLSWLDILVFLALAPVRFVSKSEVASWPLVGRYARACRTLFIERSSRRDVSRMVERLAQALSDQDVVMIFPEGTTSTGEEVLTFHANLLQAPLQSGARVQALALVYRIENTRELTRVPCFVGDQTLVASIWAILGLERFVAQILWGLPKETGQNDRRALAKALHLEVSQLLHELKGETASSGKG